MEIMQERRQERRQEHAAAARTPRYGSRVLEQFRSPQNMAYLEALLRPADRQKMQDTVYEFDETTPPASVARPSGDFWGDVRRLNRAFAAYYGRGIHGPETGHAEPASEEPYHMQAFVADSLRPPGLAHLNGAGPLYEHEASGEPASGETWAWADAAPPTRFMRYEQIPFWQRGGREGYERDIGETLGAAPCELDSPIRRWDTARLGRPKHVAAPGNAALTAAAVGYHGARA